jgi:hypothetical protein
LGGYKIQIVDGKLESQANQLRRKWFYEIPELKEVE